MAPLVLAMELASFVPGLIRALGGKKAGETAEKVLTVAKTVTGHDDPRQAIDAIKADSSKALEFNIKVLELKAAGELAEWKDEEDRRKDSRESGWWSRQVRPFIATTLHVIFWCSFLWDKSFTEKIKIVIVKIYGIEITIGMLYVLVICFYFLTKGMKDYFVGKNPMAGV